MRRIALLSLAAFALAAGGPQATSASAAFVFPRVTANVESKPQIGPARGAAPKRLQKQDVVVGTGRTAQPGDRVTADYVGVLYRGGKQFDASWDRGSAFQFDLGAGMVIPGWEKGIRGMRVGGRRTLVVPARLAYGAGGLPPAIPPRAALIFVVDLEQLSG